MAHSLTAGTASVQATGEGNTAAAQLVVLPRVFLSSAAPASATIAAGTRFVCGIISLGRGYCWGLDNDGQLGAAADSLCFQESSLGGTLPCSLNPQRFGSDIAFADVSAGESSACGVATDGRAYCWGTNVLGELGNGNTASGPPPHLVTSALRFSTVTVGGSHACALTSDGTAYCWGRDLSGELGDARVVNSTTPIPVVVNPSTGAPVSFTQISAGGEHTCGLATGNVALCWGSASAGQLGTGSAIGSTSPVAVAVPSGVTFAVVSAGATHTCALATTGAAFCWGANDRGQLGDGASGDSALAPVAVAGGLTFTQISAGSQFTCALTQSGAAYC
ncbi:MAG TPA: hypothetical protein VIM15_09075, partial [Gemmatimonadaceae bacterium]